MDQIFSDGTTDISINAGVVRIDFFRYGVAKDADGKPEREHSHRLLMSAEGFLQMYTAADEVINILLERGLIQRAPRRNTGSVAVTEGETAAAPSAPVSPNF